MVSSRLYWWNIHCTNRRTKLLFNERNSIKAGFWSATKTALADLFIQQSCWNIPAQSKQFMNIVWGEGKSEVYRGRWGGKVKIKVKLISNFYTSVWDGVQFRQTVVCRLKRSRVTAERNAGMLFWWCRWRATISPRVLENSVSISCMLPLEPWTKTQHTITSNQTHCICFHTKKKKNFQSEASSLKSCYSLLGISVCACVCIHSRVKVSKSVWIN